MIKIAFQCLYVARITTQNQVRFLLSILGMNNSLSQTVCIAALLCVNACAVESGTVGESLDENPERSRAIAASESKIREAEQSLQQAEALEAEALLLEAAIAEENEMPSSDNKAQTADNYAQRISLLRSEAEKLRAQAQIDILLAQDQQRAAGLSGKKTEPQDTGPESVEDTSSTVRASSGFGSSPASIDELQDQVDTLNDRIQRLKEQLASSS